MYINGGSTVVVHEGLNCHGEEMGMLYSTLILLLCSLSFSPLIIESKHTKLETLSLKKYGTALLLA